MSSPPVSLSACPLYASNETSTHVGPKVIALKVSLDWIPKKKYIVTGHNSTFALYTCQCELFLGRNFAVNPFISIFNPWPPSHVGIGWDKLDETKHIE